MSLYKSQTCLLIQYIQTPHSGTNLQGHPNTHPSVPRKIPKHTQSAFILFISKHLSLLLPPQGPPTPFKIGLQVYFNHLVFFIVYENKLYSNYFNKLSTKKERKGGKLNGKTKTRPRFGLEEGGVAKRTEVVAGGVAPLLVKNWQPPEPRMALLFIQIPKNNQKMYSSGCATMGSTSSGISTISLPSEQCQDYACSWGKILGLTVRGRSLFKGAPRME